MSNTPGNISIAEVIPASISDHDMIGCVRKLNHSKFKPKKLTCRNYTNYNPKEMSKDLNSDPLWDPLYSMTDVNQVWHFIKSILVSTFNKHAPIIEKNVKGRICPWLTRDIKIFLNERDQSLRKAIQLNREVDWSTYKQLRNY